MKIGIIQISDIHNSNRDKFSKVEELNSVLNAHYLSHCDSIFLVINGDMAFSGRKEEYSESELQILEIKDAIEEKLKVSCDVYCIPGNHDCDFSIKPVGRKLLIDNIQKNDISISDAIVEEVLLQDQYRSFEEIFIRDWQHTIINKENSLVKNISHLNQNGDVVININLINTAWMSELDEKPGRMVFPCQIAESKFSYDPSCLNLTIMHHPSNWLNPNNKREFDKIIMKNTDILLTGHEHGDEKNNLNGVYIFEGGVLNESGNSDESSFRILTYDEQIRQLEVIDFKWSKIEKMYTEKEGKKTYSISPKDNNAVDFMHNKITFQANHGLYLNSLEDPFRHPSKGSLNLDDIFIWPNFKNKKLGTEKKLNISGDTFRKRLRDSSPSYWLIRGSRKYGKTSLAKAIIMDLFDYGLIPIMQDSKNIKKRHINDIGKYLDNELKKQFTGLSWDRFVQEDIKKKYLIIDNWDSLEINETGIEKLFDNLEPFFGNIIVLSSNSSVTVEEVFKANEYVIEGMEEFEIRKVSNVNQEELIEKWIKRKNDFNMTNEEFSLKLEEYTDILNSVFKTATVPKSPLYINIILQALLSDQSYDFKSKGSAYFYEVLIKQTLTNIETSEGYMATLDTYLSELSFYMFNLKSGFSYDEWFSFHKNHLEKYDMRAQDFKFDVVKKELLEQELLSNTDSLFHFNHDYIYFYFIAKYLVDNIDDSEEIKNTFRELIQEIENDENTNILWFITHFKRNKYIVDELVLAAQSLLKDTPALTLDEDISVFNDLMENVPRLVYKEVNIKENRRNRNEIRDQIIDEYEDEENGLEQNRDNISEYKQSPEVIEYIRACKLSEAFGNVLKNYSGSLLKKEKELLAQVTLDLSLKSHSQLINRFSSNTDHFVNLFSEMILKKGTRNKEESIKKSKEFVFSLVNALCFSMIQTTVSEISTKNLLNLFDRLIKDDQTSTALSLISYGVFIDNNNFNDSLINIMKDKFDVLSENKISRSTLRFLIIHQLLYCEMPHQKKQRVCQLFNIDYKDAVKGKQLVSLREGS